MEEILVTIGGQPVYRRGEAPDRGSAAYRDARDLSGRLLATTEMSPSGWASGGNEETIEAGLPYLGAVVAVILLTVVALILGRRTRQGRA
jgi:hypothetical protein